MMIAMNPLRWSYRSVYLLGFLVCAALMAFALYLQHHEGLHPCELCIFQRVGFIFMGLCFLVGGLHAPRRWPRWIYALLVLVGAIWGIVAASRQLWLQSRPPGSFLGGCGAPLAYQFQHESWLRVFKGVFAGSGDCSVVHWTFLGLSMSWWTLIWFVLLAFGALWAACAHRGQA